MHDLTSKMDGVLVEEVLAATEVDLTLAPELAQARGVQLVTRSASNTSVGETV